MKGKYGLIAVCWGAAMITILDLFALSQGINGTLFSASLAAIAFLMGGYCGFTSGKDIRTWWKDRGGP